MRIEVGQKIDVEIDLEDLFDPVDNKIVATWFHKGSPIYVELEINQTLVKEIMRHFENTKRRSVLLSISRISQRKYLVQPTVVVVQTRT